MKLKYNAIGQRRKDLVQVISEITGAEKHYKGAPTFEYEVDYFTISKDGTVSFNDMADSEEIENLIEQLYKMGFECISQEYDINPPEFDVEEPPEDCPPPYGVPEECDIEIDGFSIGIPSDKFSDTDLEKLKAIVSSKEQLFKRAIGTSKDLLIDKDDEGIWFDWFDGRLSDSEVKLYGTFIRALMDMARNAKRVTAKEKPIDNEKFAMRTFLIRLGLSGAEHKQLRKALMKNLTGNAAFRHPKE